MRYSYPTNDKKLFIPEKVLHGTTSIGKNLILKHGILERGFNTLGRQKKPASLDFGEGFYTTYYDDSICREQVWKLANTRAKMYQSQPLLLTVEVNREINFDSKLKCVFFDGIDDGLDWANYIVHHRTKKDKNLCNISPCDGHPDIIIGPVADGSDVTALAHQVAQNQLKLEDFYSHISKATWFPKYRQIVFSGKALKYLKYNNK